ncbi:uncharacterized protein LOC134290475 [Aedes albopictus]|uniref:Uncharacterized protein n=1 Tax=Aedes albopictus TaxID=7160 RepID=A0ABM1Z8W9_AEDAL
MLQPIPQWESTIYRRYHGRKHLTGSKTKVGTLVPNNTWNITLIREIFSRFQRRGGKHIRPNLQHRSPTPKGKGLPREGFFHTGFSVLRSKVVKLGGHGCSTHLVNPSSICAACRHCPTFHHLSGADAEPTTGLDNTCRYGVRSVPESRTTIVRGRVTIAYSSVPEVRQVRKKCTRIIPNESLKWQTNTATFTYGTCSRPEARRAAIRYKSPTSLGEGRPRCMWVQMMSGVKTVC